MQQKSPWRRIAITVSAMAGVLLLAASYRYVESRGLFASTEDKAPASCHAVAGIGAVADLAVDKSGNAYIAADGALYGYDGKAAVRFAGTPKDFHPAALSVAEDGTLVTVFRQDTVWELSVLGVVSPGVVKEVGRLSADTLTDPAAIIALPAGRFYLVNRHASRTALGRWLDDTFLVPRAEIQFFDGMKFIPVATRLNSPAGVALSGDASRLYVAEELPRRLVALSRNDFNGAVAEPVVLNLPAAPTKVALAKDGSLIVTAWPKKGAGAVYRVKTENGVPQSAELVYGSKTAPVTAAAEANGHLLIGTPKALFDCK